MQYMLIPILLLKSQDTLHTYTGERNPKILSYNIFLYKLSGLMLQISGSEEFSVNAHAYAYVHSRVILSVELEWMLLL